MEPEQIGDLIDRLGAGLRLFARQWSDSPDDVVQDAFVALAGLAAEPREPVAWLYRAVRNGAINAGIAERRRRHREAVAASRTDAWFEPQAANPSHQAVDPESAQLALAALPADQREVIVTHLWGGLTFDQIATLTGTSTSSAHRHYQAGLQAIRNQLGAPCRSLPTPKTTT